MNQLQAFRDTVALAQNRGMPDNPGSVLGLAHLREMLATVDRGVGFSPAKLGRWLGWAQCAVVAAGIATLDEMKILNAEHLGTTKTGNAKTGKEPAQGEFWAPRDRRGQNVWIVRVSETVVDVISEDGRTRSQLTPADFHPDIGSYRRVAEASNIQ